MIGNQGSKILPEVGMVEVKANSAVLFTILWESHDFHRKHGPILTQSSLESQHLQSYSPVGMQAPQLISDVILG